jgi:hypothetical protein
LSLPYYIEVKKGVTCTRATAGTALGPNLSAEKQSTLARLSYGEIRSFIVN